MLSSVKPKESRKERKNGRRVRASTSTPADCDVQTKDFDPSEIEKSESAVNTGELLQDSLYPENKEHNEEERMNIDKPRETSVSENNGILLNKEESSLCFLEDGEALDVLLLFETDNDNKSCLPEESTTIDNIPSELGTDPLEESNDSGSTTKPLDYRVLLNEVREITLYEETGEPSAPDFIPTGEEIQEPSEGVPCMWLNTDSASEVSCLKEQPDILELNIKQKSYTLKPYTEEELGQFYFNLELKKIDKFITSFLKEETNLQVRVSHPFYKLLSKYLEAQNNIYNSNFKLKSLGEKMDQHISQIWTVWNDMEVNKTGKCADGTSLSLRQKYMRAYFNEDAFENFKTTLTEIRTLLFEVVKEDSFNCLRYRLKVMKYVESIITSSLDFTCLCEFSPITTVRPCSDTYFQECMTNLKTAIGILFFFQRKQKADMCPIFVKDSRKWLSDLVAVLVRVGNWKDHLFVLNHVVRCPSGFGEWAARYIQFPTPGPGDPFSNPAICHMMATLTTLVEPVEERENFINEWDTITASDECSWVMIDSDDDEEEIESVPSPLKESDLVMMLNQIPFKDLFASILGFQDDNFDPDLITLDHLIKLFAFCLYLIKILHVGLQAYSAKRYKQFVKRLGRLISHVIEYITAEVDLFMYERREVDPESLDRLQAEYDSFFLKSAKAIFSSRVHGTWQFLTVVPYHRASESVVLELYNALLLNETELGTTVRVNLAEFEEKFVTLPASEQFYLLSTFTSMALARDVSELDFIKAVVQQLLYIGFLSNATKEECFKNVKSLLFNLCFKHAILMSEILRIQDEHFTLNRSRDQSLTVHLWRELPLKNWKPTFGDLNIFQSWLLKPVPCLQNELARMILKSLNYDGDEENLFLPRETHQMVAHILLKVSEKLCSENETTIMKNVSSLVGLQEPEQALHVWSWNMLLRLRLHLFDQSPASVRKTAADLHEDLRNIPDVDYNQQLRELVEQKNPFACYVALMTTTLGHSVPIIHTDGFPLIEVLIRARKHEMAIVCIEYVTLMFLECPDSLSKCAIFTSILSQLINADASYLKLGKNLKTSEAPSPILICLENMIQSQIQSCDVRGISRSTLVEMWLKSLAKLPTWTEDPGVVYLVDSICKYAFFDGNTSKTVGDVFSGLLREITQPAESKSSFASLVNWMNNKISIPTLLPRGYNGDAVWFALKAMEIEKKTHETNNHLWMDLLRALQTTNDKKTNVDNCLKKVCNNLDIPTRTSDTLIIYRLCYQILETKPNHSVIITVWQRFFLLYFTRIPGYGGSVGEKFFHGMVNQNLLKKVKTRLMETLNCFGELHLQCDRSDPRSKYLLRCTEILHAFQCWLDDQKLQEPCISLRTLPPKYETQLFATVVQDIDEFWPDSVDCARVQSEIEKCCLNWQELKNRRTKDVAPPKQSSAMTDKSLIAKLRDGLKRYEDPLPPPDVNVKKDKFQVTFPNFKAENFSITSYMSPSLRKILDYSDYYVQEVGEYVGISCDLQDLVKLLYKMKNTSVTIRETCGGYEKIISGKKFTFKCSGPAVAVLLFEESKVDNKCFELFNQVLRNFNRNLQRTLTPLQDDLGQAVLTVEKISEQLADWYSVLKDDAEHEDLALLLEKGGVELFYDLVESWTESVIATPSIAAVFEDSINVLGKTFIAESPQQCFALLGKINEQPKLVDLVKEHLNPNVCATKDFIELYSRIRKSHSEIRYAALSRFDIEKWLAEEKPRVSEISSLLSEISAGLKMYGPSPDGTDDIVKVYNTHLKLLLVHEFPERFGEVLNLLLEGSESQAMPASTWFTFINTFVPDGVFFVEGKCDANTFEPGQCGKKLKYMFAQYAAHQKLLSLKTIKETMSYLASIFKTDRLKHGLYGLYPKYHYYVEPILILCGMLTHSFICETVKLDLGTLSSKIADHLWPRVRDLYAPWLIPYWSKQEKAESAKWIQELTEDKFVLLPWVSSDVSFANFSCGIFIDTVRYFIDALPGVNSLLNSVWVFYVTHYAHIQIKDHVLRVVHKHLLRLPWTTLFPSLQDVELMVKVVEHFIPMSHSLLGSIFVEVRWIDVVKHYEEEARLESLSKLHVYLLNLLVKLPCEPSLKQNNEIILLLTEAKYFSWHLVDSTNYDFILNWFVMSCDPRLILKDEKSEYFKLDSLILELLRICAGFSEISVEFHRTTQTKRLMYVRAYNKWLITANNRFKCKDLKSFKAAFITILNEIEAISDATNPNDLAALLSEFLNIFKEEELCPGLEESLINWFGQKKGSKIVYGLLRSIAVSAISPTIFGNIADACLNCYFESNESCSWADINDRFVTYASGQSGALKTTLIDSGNLLTLYAIILKQCSDITNLFEEKIVINEIFQSITTVKKSKEIEPKLVLMVIYAFKIADSVSQLDERECMSILTQLSANLNHICNYKGNGLLSTIGLKKGEQFTDKFKFICLMARGAIMKLFQTRFATQEEEKLDERIVQTLDPVQIIKKYQCVSQYVDPAVEEMTKIETIEEVVVILKTLGFKMYNKNYLK